MRRKKLFFIIPAAIVGMLVFITLGGWVVMLLWNWLTPALFGWKLLTFWQALGLLALCRILLGGAGPRGGGGRGGRRRIRERIENMTPEERERLRQRWCGFDAPRGQAEPQ